MSLYAKAITALLGALATWGVTAAEDAVYTQMEWWGLLLALATALTVYSVPNRAPGAGERFVREIRDHGNSETGLMLLIAGLLVLILGVVVIWRDAYILGVFLLAVGAGFVLWSRASP